MSALLVLGGCHGVEAGPALVGGVVWSTADPTAEGRLIERPLWVVGPDDVDRATLGVGKRKVEGLFTVECGVREDGRLHHCVPLEAPPALGDETGPFLAKALGTTFLALRLQLATTDEGGEAVRGGRVRVTRDMSDVVGFDPARVVPPVMLTVPPVQELAAHYPFEAEMRSVAADTYLICVVSEAGEPEGCQVALQEFFGWSEDLGFGAASLELYKDIRVSPQMVDGRPVR
ncbi:hypothetical protein [Brevundimonas sp.]|uniref:hypothetical protein n=1 Tax=Brevundimonas sp. TaxID=1871086 RepID=UPI003D6CC369